MSTNVHNELSSVAVNALKASNIKKFPRTVSNQLSLIYFFVSFQNRLILVQSVDIWFDKPFF